MSEEIELKYTLTGDDTYAHWAGVTALAPSYRVAPAATSSVAIVDSYLDTPDRRFLRHGYALRQRRAGDRVLLSLKSLAAAPEMAQTGSLHRRREVEGSLNSTEETFMPAQWPPAIYELAEPLLADEAELKPCAVVRQTREKRIITREGAALAAVDDVPGETAVISGASGVVDNVAYVPFRAELSVDSVEVVSPVDGCAVTRRYEMEVELLQGSEDELRDIAGSLSHDEALTPQTQSKYEDALRTLARYAPSACADTDPRLGINPAMPMAEAARTILHQQFVDLLLNEPGVRYGDDMEFVHDMRVATRRARVVLDIFAPYLKPKTSKYLAKQFRRTGRLLGAVRDLDVALHNATTQPAHPKQDTVLKRWRKQRKAAFATLIDWLDSRNYAAFIQRLDTFVSRPGKGTVTPHHEAGQRPPAFQVRHVMPVLLTAQFAAVRSYETLFTSDTQVDYATIHRLRIDAKYLRYELEFMREFLGTDGETLIHRLKKLQDHLGELNDAVVAMSMLEQADGAEIDDGPGAEELLLQQQALVQKLMAATPAKLARFCQKKNRRRLGRALAQF